MAIGGAGKDGKDFVGLITVRFSFCFGKFLVCGSHLVSPALDFIFRHSPSAVVVECATTEHVAHPVGPDGVLNISDAFTKIHVLAPDRRGRR